MTGLLCLKWNNHSSSFLKKLSVIYSKEIYCDATIACQDKFYPVHRLVLSTCSEYFEEIFERVQCRHPFIIVKDICPSELEALLSYMYNGEVHVLQDTLPGLIRAAETLKIKGLAVPETPFSTEHGALNKLKEKLDAAFPSLQRKRIRRESAESSKTNSNSQDIWPSSETNSNRVEPPSGTKSELGNEYSIIDKEDNESIDIKIETVEEQIIDHYDQTRESVPPGDSSTAHMAVLKSPQDNLVSHPVEDNILNSEVNTAQCSSWDGIVEINSNAGVAQGEHKEVAQRPVGRPSISSVESEHAAKRKKGHNTHDIPEVNIRKDLVGHWPMIMQGTERPRCKVPSCNGRTNVYCIKCNVNLCFKKEKNCFYKFHHN